MTGGVPGGERLFSVREVSHDIRNGLIELTIGLWLVVFGDAGQAERFADLIEGWLIARERKTPPDPKFCPVTLHSETGTIVVLLNAAEGAIVVEEVHRALGALERWEEDAVGWAAGEPEGGDDEPGTRFVEVPPARDTEPHPAPAPDPDDLELGRGAGGLLTLAEVCS